MNNRNHHAERRDAIDRLDIGQRQARRAKGARRRASRGRTVPSATPASRKPSTGLIAQAEKQRRDDPRRHKKEQRLLVDGKIGWRRSRGFPLASELVQSASLVDLRSAREPLRDAAVARRALAPCYQAALSAPRSSRRESAAAGRWRIIGGRSAASIMALAPVIPVLTVRASKTALDQARALVAGGLYAIEVTLRTAERARRHRGDRAARSRRRCRRRHDRLTPSRSPRRAPRARAFWSAPARLRALAQGAAAVARSIPARMRDRVRGHDADGARLSRAQTVSRPKRSAA